MYLTSDDVRDILHLLDALPFDELHLRTESFSLSLRRGAAGEWTQAAQELSQPHIVHTVPGTASAAGTDGTATPNTAATPDGTASTGGTPKTDDTASTAGEAQGQAISGGERLADVTAPLPGTFYRAPRPGAPAFIEVGSQVGPDTVVGIIETMKLMNSVTAGLRGTVAQICLADAQFAGQDAVLMRIEPEVA